MLLAPHNADANANGVTWPQSHVTPHFNHLNASSVMTTNDYNQVIGIGVGIGFQLH